MKAKQLFVIGSAGVLVAMLIIVVVSAQSGVVKPYLEGQGGEAGRANLPASEPDRPYAEGEGARASGSRILGEDAALEEEGAAGMAGTLVIEEAAAALEQSLAPPGFSVLYRFTGVRDDGEQGSVDAKVATTVHCTNLAPFGNDLYVEVYDFSGTTVYTGTIDLPTGASRTFSTQNTAIYDDDVYLGGSPGTGEIDQGHGVIFAENSQVICTAQILDPSSLPPSFVSQLPIFRD